MNDQMGNGNSTLIEALEYLDAGISVFDSDLNLLVSNARFRELLAFPAELCVVGAPLAEMFRFNAARGEYGPGDSEVLVAQRIALAKQGIPHCTERERPDGTVIEIRGNVLPDGSFITIYTDVTERHRHARELEEARLSLEERVEERTRELSISQRQLAEKSSLLERIIDQIRHGITMFDQDLNLVLTNRQFLDLMRFPHELGQPGTPFSTFIRLNALRGEYGEGEIDELVRERLERACKMTHHRFERTRPDGTAIEVIGAPLEEGGFVSTYTDITDRKKAEATLQESENRLRTVLEMGPIAVCIADLAEGFIRFCNRRMIELFALSDEVLRGNRLAALVSDEAHWSALMSKFYGNGGFSAEEVQFLRGDAACFWGLVTATPLEFEGQPSVLVWVYDVTHLRNAREQMASMAYQDSLTRLGNRRYFSEATMGALSRARNKTHPCALLFCDLDGFKAINDRYGHETGDAVLIEVSRRLESCLRKGDIVARMGGDEFAILLENSPASEKVELLAEKIRNRISDPIRYDGIEVQVGVSVGVVVITDTRDLQDTSLDNLIQIADRAMYSAKQGGKGRVVLVNHCI